ncbi:MAG: hypothetical protein R2684_11960 [Pyrinomonadaceae bacterium]
MNPEKENLREETRVIDTEVAVPVSEEGVSPFSGGENRLGELRRILIGKNEVSEVLPDAVIKSNSESKQLSEATLPIVEDNIRESVVRNPRILADALFPVIGPAIRKAIAAALGSMVQSFNTTLEHSVSPKGIRWRLEAMRTGRPFGEVVLLHTLLYSVEQVFLIHRKTGLLLEHAARNPRDIEDADMVSSMLTAITDFAHDSFKTDEDATLDSFQVSGLTVWIENSPHAILAAAIRGNPPLELRETFVEAVESIQSSFERELTLFEGDSSVFSDSKPILEDCLRFQSGEASKKGPLTPTNLVLGVAGLLLLGVIAYFAWDYWKWSSLLADIRSEPGYVLTDYQRGWFSHSVEGLRDPMASDAALLLERNRYDKEDVEFVWREFQDTDPKFALERIKTALALPPGIAASIKDGVVTLEGDVSDELAAEAKRIAPLVAGVNSISVKSNQDAKLKASIEKRRLEFRCGTAEPLDSADLEAAAADVSALAALGKFDVEVIPASDGKGDSDTNIAFNKRRAEFVAEAISSKLKSQSRESAINVKIGEQNATDNKCVVGFRIGD